MLAVLVALSTLVAAQAPQAADAAAVRAAVVQLGSFDFATRTSAARLVRRAPAALTTAALQDAVRNSVDEYVQYRALVLLTSVAPAAARIIAAEVLTHHNDRLRTVAYQWFEHHPEAAITPRLVDALSTERSEFVRPALMRALAAAAAVEAPAALKQSLQTLVLRGEDLFRGATIDALGDYGVTFALDPIVQVAELDGPLQDDAITAIGRIGDASTRPLLAKLQATVPRELQPTVSAALCLQGVDCDARLAYLVETLAFATQNGGYQPLLRGAVHGLSVLAIAGRDPALGALLDAGVRAPESARAPIALGVGTVALRKPQVVMRVLQQRADVTPALALLRDAFDMLSEDFEKERFALEVRRMMADPATDANARRLAERVLTELEY